MQKLLGEMNEQQKEELVRQWRDSSAKRRGIPEQMEIDEVVRDLRCVAKEGWLCVTVGADLIDQLRQRVAEAEAKRDLNAKMLIEELTRNEHLEAKLALAEKWTRAWRNRFIDERMNAYTEASYEMKRCYAESDANEFEAAFTAAIASQGKK